METISQDKTVGALKKIISCFSSKDLTVAQNRIAQISNIGAEALKYIRIPIITSDEEVLQYIKEFELDRPDVFIHYLVETAFAPADEICNGINDLKEENLKECIDIIRTQKENYLRRKKKQNTNVDTILDKLAEMSNVLESKVEMYINAINRIDSRSKLEFFIKSIWAVPQLKANVSFAKNAVTSYVMANNLYMLIASQCNEHYQDRLDAYERFMERVLLGNNVCLLMHAYDPKQEEEFWLKIEELKKQAYVISEITNEINDDNDEYDVENIDFS